MSLLLVATGFMSQSAMAFDHQHTNYAKFLEGAVTDTGVDYAKLKERKATLDGYLDEVANASAASFSKDEKLAFYVNAYNALTINLILTENPKSIKDLDGGKVWEQRSFNVGKKRMSLNQIENDTVRPMSDGRVHAVLNCASKGCPPLPKKAMMAAGVQGQMDAAAKTWVRVNAFKMDGKVLQLSNIFLWYGDDFVDMAANTASEGDKQKGAIAFITKYGGDVSAHTSIEWADYDWSVNAL